MPPARAETARGKRKKAPRRAGATLLGAGKMSCTGEKLGAKRLYCCGRPELCFRPEGGSADRMAGGPAGDFIALGNCKQDMQAGKLPRLRIADREKTAEKRFCRRKENYCQSSPLLRIPL